MCRILLSSLVKFAKYQSEINQLKYKEGSLLRTQEVKGKGKMIPYFLEKQ